MNNKYIKIASIFLILTSLIGVLFFFIFNKGYLFLFISFGIYIFCIPLLYLKVANNNLISTILHIVGILIVFLPVLKAINDKINFIELPQTGSEFIYNLDSGIQTQHKDSVPQLSKTGHIQFQYNSNSIFPIIMWGADGGREDQYLWTALNLNDEISRNTYPEVKEAGFNSIGGWMHAALYEPTKTQTINHLNYINSLNLKVFIELKHIIVQDINNNNWNGLREAIRIYKDHPAVMGWYIFDEVIEDGTASKFVEAMNLIKNELDPNRPVFPNYYCGGTNWPAYRGANLASMDCYRIGNANTELVHLDELFSMFYNDSKFNRSVIPFFPILQVHKEESKISLSRPTRSQLRGQVYQQIIRGATGYWLFVHHDPYRWGQRIPYNQEGDGPLWGASATNPNTVELWANITELNKEVDKYKQIYLSKTANINYHLYTDTYINVNPIRTVLKQSNDSNIYYLLAGSLKNTTFNLKVEFEGKTITQVTSMFDNRNINTNGNYFIDSYSNLKVNLYRINFGSAIPTDSPTPLPTFTNTPTPTNIPNPTYTNTPTNVPNPTFTNTPTNVPNPTYTNTPIPTNVFEQEIECGGIDINSDNKLDYIDLFEFIKTYNRKCIDDYPSNIGCGGKDTNGDHTINYIDLYNFINKYYPKSNSCI